MRYALTENPVSGADSRVRQQEFFRLVEEEYDEYAADDEHGIASAGV